MLRIELKAACDGDEDFISVHTGDEEGDDENIVNISYITKIIDGVEATVYKEEIDKKIDDNCSRKKLYRKNHKFHDLWCDVWFLAWKKTAKRRSSYWTTCWTGRFSNVDNRLHTSKDLES